MSIVQFVCGPHDGLIQEMEDLPSRVEMLYPPAPVSLGGAEPDFRRSVYELESLNPPIYRYLRG